MYTLHNNNTDQYMWLPMLKDKMLVNLNVKCEVNRIYKIASCFPCAAK